MNSLSPDVMKDLLTLVLAGEASADTRRLVDTYAKEDAGYAALLRNGQDEPLNLPSTPSKDVHMSALNMTRHYIFMRSLYLGLGIAFSLLPFAFIFNHDGIVFLMMRDQPTAAAVFGAIGIASWIGCFAMSRRVGQAGL